MSYRILVPQAIASEGVAYLEERGYEVVNGSGAAEEDLIRDVVDCDGILLRTAPVTRAVLEAGKQLKIVARHGAGYNNVDLKAAEELGIWVTNAPDSTTKTVGEFVLGALLASAKRTFLMNKKMAEGEFFYKNNHKGVDVRGRTLSVIGFGRIGREVAEKAHAALDMKILAYDPYAKPESCPEYARLVDWETAFREGDFVTLHMPLTADNRGFIGAREFAMMKPTAHFINCARGEVVDEPALVEALKTGQIAAAFLDVLTEEPPKPDNPLLHMDNVSLTPHMASNTEECMALMATQAASQIHRVLSGEKPDWPVNHPEWTRMA
ncbi:phosphoglycerate dehydrogenase [Lachnoclostridium sp. An14]|uniref:hydroxyacid dehydrogenase n=1 Tax=Lachnoclostridium sp. An14 TaxID=1965562 RepID=UPI000B3A5F14|nr:hydroxyacid dehydrogenase [Lachnoclostridium sp. An14]OUQ17228.1 phosphoglycerate dehydrogenase [Lachnoclostridium sp. An14]